MSTRYSISLDQSSIEKRFNVKAGDKYVARFNAAPSQPLPVIANIAPDSISYFHWGQSPGWAKNKAISTKLLHVDIQILNEKASLRRAMQQRRCLVPADGFYVWKNVGRKSKIPYRVVLNSGEPFSFAGIWESYEDENDQVVYTFKIITIESNVVVEDIQNTMPAILSKQAEKIWMDEDATDEQLLDIFQTKLEASLTKYTVSPKIDMVEIDESSLIQPAPAADQYGNYSLFD